jgi:hypothetical protein
MDADQTIVATALAAESSAETPRNAIWEVRSGASVRSPVLSCATTTTTPAESTVPWFTQFLSSRSRQPLGGLELADQELAASADEAGVEGVRAIAQRIERSRGRVERAHRPAQVVRGEGDLGLGDLAARLGEALAGTEAAGGAPEELARPVVVAELGHGDAAQGDGRRVVAQCDALEGAEGITGRQRARGPGDEGVHGWKDAPDLGERACVLPVECRSAMP